MNINKILFFSFVFCLAHKVIKNAHAPKRFIPKAQRNEGIEKKKKKKTATSLFNFDDEKLCVWRRMQLK